MLRTALSCLLMLAFPIAAFANGNVTTTQTEATITIQGDASANEYDVKHDTDAQGNSVLVLVGKNGTTINGTPTFEIRLNAGPTKFQNLIVSPSAGADKVVVDLSGLPADRRFQGVDVDAAVGGTTTIKNVQMEPRGRIELNTGGTVSVEDCDSTLLRVRGEEGGTVAIKNCNIDGKVNVDTTDSETEVTVQDSFLGDLKVKGGSKVNVQNRLQFRVQRGSGKKIAYESGVGDDEVAFEDSTFESISAKLGGGADWISFTRTTAEKVSLDGGAGDADCFDDTQDQNVFGSIKERGFEVCLGLPFEFFDLGADPQDEPPPDAVVWRTNNPEIGHIDGPYALPGAPNPLGLSVRDPLVDVAPAQWAEVDKCAFIHLHGPFAGHGDPAPGPPDTESACGHGALEYGAFVDD